MNMTDGKTSIAKIIGELVYKATATESNGLKLCNGQAISRTTYASLFADIGTTFGAGDGSTTFNVPDMLGKVAGGAGQGIFTSTFASAYVIVAANDIIIPFNRSIFTGTAVVLSTTSTVPGGLIVGATYYAIKTSETIIKLATTRANAVAGIAIDITSQGTGNHTLTVTYTDRALGDVVGEETHALTVAELAAHTHPIETVLTSSIVGAAGNQVRSNTEMKTSGSTGGSASHNIMQPTAFAGYWFIYAG